MSTRTLNINLEKPSSDENYSIAVFNGNSDTIDAEMALRVKTADIVNNLTTTVTNKPLSAAQGKALNDAKVNVSDIQNNLTSTATNKPLSAAQGKALNDAKVNVSDIQNNLTSTATNKPLSAAQGKALSDTIATKADKSSLVYGSYEYSNQSAMESGLISVVSTIAVNSSVIIRLYPNFSSQIFGGQIGHAWITITSARSYFSVIFQNGAGVVHGYYANGTWTWKKLVAGQQTGTVSYTPSITASSTGFAVNNISFMYYVEGKRLHVSGRFNVTSGGSGSSGISISLPSGMTALNMGAGKCGEVTLNRNVAHMYSIRCDGGTSVWIQTGAGSADITSVYGSGYIQVSFDVLLT